MMRWEYSDLILYLLNLILINLCSIGDDYIEKFKLTFRGLNKWIKNELLWRKLCIDVMYLIWFDNFKIYILRICQLMILTTCLQDLHPSYILLQTLPKYILYIYRYIYLLKKFLMICKSPGIPLHHHCHLVQQTCPWLFQSLPPCLPCIIQLLKIKK